MSTGPSPEDAHRIEIMEGLIEAALRGDQADFTALNTEWERLEDAAGDNPDRYRLRFGGGGGKMERYLETGFCYHCQKSWQTSGVRFGPAIPGMGQVMHMSLKCTNTEDCKCWADIPDEPSTEFIETHPFGWPNCQRCGRAEPICECDGGISYGPCALVWVSGTKKGASPEE